MKRTATNALIIHTTASNTANLPDHIQNYFLYYLKWSKGGYHTIFAQDGQGKAFYSWKDEMTNGILPSPDGLLHNGNTIHISYVGGINNRNANEAVCNITPAQEASMIATIQDILKWYPKIKILGHNQVNHKACPSFWVADWLRAWGIAEANIDERDPYNMKNWVKTQVPHPLNFYKARGNTENKETCPTCGQVLKR